MQAELGTGEEKEVALSLPPPIPTWLAQSPIFCFLCYTIPHCLAWSQTIKLSALFSFK